MRGTAIILARSPVLGDYPVGYSPDKYSHIREILHIVDEISSIVYDSAGDQTNITLWRYDGGTTYSKVFTFEGNLSGDFEQGDQANITVTIKRVAADDSGFYYDLEVFEEQWENEHYFTSRVTDYTEINKGFKAMPSDAIVKVG